MKTIFKLFCAILAFAPLAALGQHPDFHQGPQPAPHFDQGHQGDFHGNDFHGDFHQGFHGGYGYPQPIYVNPLPFVAPVIINQAVGQRYVTNPATGQLELRGPGQWSKDAAGNLYYQSSIVWPLGSSQVNGTSCPENGATTASVTSSVRIGASGPIRRIIRQLPIIRRFRQSQDDPCPPPDPDPTPVIPPLPDPAPTPPSPPGPAPDVKPIVIPPVVPPAPGSQVADGTLLIVCVLPSLVAQTDLQGKIPGAIGPLLAAHKNHWNWIDPTIAGPTRAAYVARATADGLPRILVVDETANTIVESVPLTTADDAADLVKKWSAK